MSRIRFMGFCPLAVRGRPSIILSLAPHRLLLHTGLHFPSPIALITPLSSSHAVLITQLSPITRSPERIITCCTDHTAIPNHSGHLRGITHTIQKTFSCFHRSLSIVLRVALSQCKLPYRATLCLCLALMYGSAFITPIVLAALPSLSVFCLVPVLSSVYRSPSDSYTTEPFHVFQSSLLGSVHTSSGLLP